MAVPGIGLQTTTQYAPRSNEQRALSKDDITSKNETQTAAAESTGQNSTAKGALFPTVTQSTDTTESTTSRQSLAELESIRNRFQLQQEGQKLKGQSAKALQSFLDVAEFERKDDLNSLIGLDIFA